MTQNHRSLRLSLTYLLAALLLTSMFGLTLASSLSKSPVLPESHVVETLASLGLIAAPDTASAARVTFLARLPLMMIGLMLAALMFRWGRRVYGLWPGLITLTLVAFSPTIIAYSQHAIADLAGAALALVALYGWTRHIHHPTRRRAIAAGALAGLALAVSTLTVSLVISLLILTAWHALERGPERRARVRSLLAPWAAFGVTIAALAGAWQLLLGSSPRLAGLSALPVTLADFSGQRGYLLGRFTDEPWSYLLLLLLKMTIPEMLTLALAAVLITMRGLQHHEWDFIIPILVHLLVVTPFLLPSLEIRYLLFAIPLIALFASRAAAPTLPTFSWRRMIATGLIAGVQIPICLGAFPHYLSYFNATVGGSENGYWLATGSNLDWGQDLPGLARYMREHHIEQINLSYYGAADPAAYGVNATWLVSWPHPADVRFPPLAPPPGIYAISASNLIGLPSDHFPPETYAWFLSRKPMAVIGHSIFIYGVSPEESAPGVWGAVCASPDPVEPDDALRRLSGDPNLSVFNFDCRQSLAIPQGAGWVVLPADVDPIVDLGPAAFVSPSGNHIWKINQPPPEPASTITQPQARLPLPIADHLELLGYQVSDSIVPAGQTLVVTEWWRVRQPPPPPVSISARLVSVNSSGGQQDVLSGDALGLRAELWTPGLTLIQKNALSTSSDFPSGEYSLEVGLFDANTGRHFPVAETADQVIDRIILQKITVTASSR